MLPNITRIDGICLKCSTIADICLGLMTIKLDFCNFAQAYGIPGGFLKVEIVVGI